MKLFKGDTIKKVNKLIKNGEKRKAKLVERISELKEEVEIMYQSVQDDFNLAILEDKEPSKKLSSDLEKVREELKDKQFQLSQVDIVIKKELEKAKNEVDKERMEFVKEHGEDFRKQFDKMNQLKIEYLESIIEFSKMKNAYVTEYSKSFRNIENRVGLRNRDPRDDFSISLNQRYQTAEHYNPMVYNDELSDALHGKLHGLTTRFKDKYKK